MSSSTQFRPMSEADLDWVAAAEQLIYPFPWSRQNFSESLVAGYSCWMLQLAGINAGYAVQMLVLDEVHLLNISVIPEMQGRGCGAALLDHLCQAARRAGANQMYLEVRDSNTHARDLYQKWGFEPIGRRKGYYPAHNGREDAVVMRRAL